MKSVVFEKVGSAGVADVPDPTLRASSDVIIGVERTAICGSDLHPYRGEWGDPEGQRPGHEFIGEVLEIGSDVRRHKVGDRVLVSGAVGCGSCALCAHGLSAACTEGIQVLGIPMLTDYPGGQAEYVAVPDADAALLAIPEAVSPEAALLLTDNLCTGWQGAVRADTREGCTAVVIGFGPVGMCAAMSCRELGAWDIFVIDPLASRREFAGSLGFVALDATDDAVSEIVEQTGGGADCVVETAGRSASTRAAVGAAHATGTISAVSVPSELYDAQPTDLLGTYQRYRSTTCSPQRAWQQLLPRLGSPAFERIDEIFSHTMALDDADKAYDLFSNRSSECRKVQFAVR